jgi:hypothetical protein
VQQISEREYLDIGTGDPIEGDNLMEFRLLYEGRVLGSSRNDSRASVKHAIRKEFHPQLRRLWETNENLIELQRMIGHTEQLNAYQLRWRNRKNLSPELSREADAEFNAMNAQYNNKDNPYAGNVGRQILVREWQRNGYSFLPLVTSRISLRCSLEILFLRPEESGMLFESGDLDNRVKTLVDALRMPKNLSECGGEGPGEGEDPFYCLLEDDKLISEIRVTSGQLLLLPHQRELHANDAFVIIKALILPVQFSMEGLRFVP